MDQAGNRPADDFTVLPGIGSAINRRLHDAGVGSFRALSKLDIDRLAELLVGIPSVSANRLGNADWIGRAALLARSTETAGELSEEGTESAPERGATDAGTEATPTYESFVLCAVTAPPGHVARIRLQHVRTGAVRYAADGLDELPRIISEMLASASREAAVAAPGAAGTSPAPSTAGSPDPAGTADDGRDATLAPVATLAVQAGSKVVRADGPLIVEVRIGRETSTGGAGEPVHYAASVAARPLGRARRPFLIARGSGPLPDDLAIVLPATALDAGTYWLEAVVELTDSGSDLVIAFAESMLTVSPVEHEAHRP